MRYTPETRINNPSMEYVKLWAALDELNLIYTKICRLKLVDDYRENWTVPALIKFGVDAYQFDHAAIEFKENYYPNHNGMSKKTKAVKQRLLIYCQDNNIPVLLISRKKSQAEMNLSIRKWLDQLRKEI